MCSRTIAVSSGNIHICRRPPRGICVQARQIWQSLFRPCLRYFSEPRYKSLLQGSETTKPPGRPLTFDADQENSVLEFVRHGFSSGSHVTQTEVTSFVSDHFQKTVTSS